MICRVFAYAMNLILPTSPLVFQQAVLWAPHSAKHCSLLPLGQGMRQREMMLCLPVSSITSSDLKLSIYHKVPSQQQKISSFTRCFESLQHPVCPIKSGLQRSKSKCFFDGLEETDETTKPFPLCPENIWTFACSEMCNRPGINYVQNLCSFTEIIC